MCLAQKKAVMTNRGGKGLQKPNSQIANINPDILVITLNVNGLNSSKDQVASLMNSTKRSKWN